jgi:phosphohistidine swiveling domain-containing protein
MIEDTKQLDTELPIPPGFPVAWESDEERKLLWRWDDIHSPLPATPMSVSIGDAVSQGSARASQEMRRTGRSLRRRINGYSYSASLPVSRAPEQEAAEREAMEQAIVSTRRRWDTEFLPTLERNLGYMRGVDMASASDGQLLDYLDEFLELHKEHWRIHGLVVTPLHTAAERMATLYREIMGHVPDEEPYLLLQGIDNKSLETDRAIQSLAEEARQRPSVAALFAEARSPEAIMAALAASRQGIEFLKRLRQFLSVYGYRPTGFDYVFPSWIEDPSFVLLNVRSYLSSPPRDLEAERTALLEEAQRLLRGVMDRLRDNEARRAAFMDAYRHALELWPLKEDHSFYIDQGSTATLRMLIAEMGRRLARRGVLDGPEDVFYVTLDELRVAMRSAGAQSLSYKVRPRREERQRFMKIVPPPFLGAMPPEGAPGIDAAFSRMTGPVSTSRPDEGARALRGVPASKGVATGPAKVVRSPAEFDKVRAGDVLVCVSTSPTWTPLLGSVGALVSDSGGVLSHTAIVAREYRLPAVVGVKYGTSLIADGQVITVDGDAGVVLLR